ncbi:MAG TPA: oligosaccharide flippase family protein, partial [Ardenticatenaceae bacterium]|nr:oligosaccharide flippase family protein [Ardenticatenaceae bacterium]
MSRSTIFARLILSPTVRAWSRLTRNPVNRYSAMVLFGNLARFGLGFIASVLLARGLGPAGMGIYASLGVVVVIATVLLDFGLTPTAINRMAERLGAGNDARTVSGTYFWLKFGIAAVGCAIGTLAAGPLARFVLGSVGGPGLLRLALWSVFAAALSGASAAMLQASGRFQALVRTWLVNTVLTVLLVVGLTLTAALNVGTAFRVAILTSLAGFAAGLYW